MRTPTTRGRYGNKLRANRVNRREIEERECVCVCEWGCDARCTQFNSLKKLIKSIMATRMAYTFT